MALYIPRAFAVDDRASIERLIDEHPFAMLITPASPEPHISHVPLLRDGGDALIGHFARANPHWRHVAGVASIAVFHGPHAYVSPAWYEDPKNAVPTWNYAAVHVRGTLELPADAADAEHVLARLVARFEGTGGNAWRFTLEGRARDAMLANIVAFRMRVQSIDAKFKLSQNRTAEDRRRVIAALATGAGAEAAATAAWMREHAAPGDGEA